jgi:hypothetical protein
VPLGVARSVLLREDPSCHHHREKVDLHSDMNGSRSEEGGEEISRKMPALSEHCSSFTDRKQVQNGGGAWNHRQPRLWAVLEGL